MSRKLSLIGKIQVIKTFMVSNFQYTFSVIPIPTNYIKEINKILFSFIWNGKNEKVKRNTMVRDIEKGGLRAPHLLSMILTSRVRRLKHYLKTENIIYQALWEYNFKKVNIDFNFLLHCNYSIQKMKLSDLSQFYREVLQSWELIRANNNIKFEDQFLWYNNLITIENKSIFCRNLMQSGAWFIKDLFDNNQVIPFNTWVARGVKQNNYLLWRSLIVQCRTLQKKNDNGLPYNIEYDYEDLNVSSSNGMVTPLKYTISKNIYEFLLDSLIGSDTIEPKIISKFCDHDTQLDYSKYYILPAKVCIDTKLRSFQFKFVNNCLVNNYLLRKWNIREDSICTFVVYRMKLYSICTGNVIT